MVKTAESILFRRVVQMNPNLSSEICNQKSEIKGPASEKGARGDILIRSTIFVQIIGPKAACAPDGALSWCWGFADVKRWIHPGQTTCE
jgi:hypothetical protein